jgi:hypothetical protein
MARDIDTSDQWRLWESSPPAFGMRVEWMRVRSGVIMFDGENPFTYEPSRHPEWNISGVWWRPARLTPQEVAAALAQARRDALEEAARVVDSTVTYDQRAAGDAMRRIHAKAQETTT